MHYKNFYGKFISPATLQRTESSCEVPNTFVRQ